MTRSTLPAEPIPLYRFPYGRARIVAHRRLSRIRTIAGLLCAVFAVAPFAVALAAEGIGRGTWVASVLTGTVAVGSVLALSIWVLRARAALDADAWMGRREVLVGRRAIPLQSGVAEVRDGWLVAAKARLRLTGADGTARHVDDLDLIRGRLAASDFASDRALAEELPGGSSGRLFGERDRLPGERPLSKGARRRGVASALVIAVVGVLISGAAGSLGEVREEMEPWSDTAKRITVTVLDCSFETLMWECRVGTPGTSYPDLVTSLVPLKPGARMDFLVSGAPGRMVLADGERGSGGALFALGWLGTMITVNAGSAVGRRVRRRITPSRLKTPKASAPGGSPQLAVYAPEAPGVRPTILVLVAWVGALTAIVSLPGLVFDHFPVLAAYGAMIFLLGAFERFVRRRTNFDTARTSMGLTGSRLHYSGALGIGHADLHSPHVAVVGERSPTLITGPIRVALSAPGSRRPDADLAALAQVLRTSPYEAGRRAAARIQALLPEPHASVVAEGWRSPSKLRRPGYLVGVGAWPISFALLSAAQLVPLPRPLVYGVAFILVTPLAYLYAREQDRWKP